MLKFVSISCLDGQPLHWYHFLHIKNSWIKQYNLEKAIKDAVWVAEQLFKKNDPPGEKEKHL